MMYEEDNKPEYYQGGHGDVLNTTSPGREVPLITSLLDRNDKALAVLQDAFNELVDKIQPALGPEQSMKRDPGETQDTPEMSLMSLRLESILRQLQSLNNHVRYIRDRVEL